MVKEVCELKVAKEREDELLEKEGRHLQDLQDQIARIKSEISDLHKRVENSKNTDQQYRDHFVFQTDEVQ